jgi:3-hydroxyisobutyrate dehydrogenase-like beta-hydroxyacid dehydrogenase
LVSSPQDIVDVDVLISVVADDRAEMAVMFESGLIDRLPRDCVHMSSTTLGIDTAQKLAAAHRKHGRIYVAAPVLGRAVDMAPNGKLFLIAAGASEGLARCAPLFAAVGQRTFEFGSDPVTAVAVKLAINFLNFSAIEAMGEAFALAAQYGVRPSDFYEFITSTLFGSPPYKAYGKLIERNSNVPANFVVPLGLKGQIGAGRRRESELGHTAGQCRTGSFRASDGARLSRRGYRSTRARHH